MTLTPDQSRAVWLSRVAFGLAIAILIARATMLEMVRDPTVPTANTPSGPGPTTSVLLDWLSLLPALLILIRRLADRSFTLRFASCHWIFFALAGWAMLSTAWADDKFLALVTSTRLLAAASLFWSMAQLVRRWDHLRIIAGVVLGLLLVNVAQGVLYRTVEFADLQRYWAEYKPQILRDHGWQPGDYAAGRFEMKLLAGEIMGFNASPNVLGALVVLMTLVGLGAAAQRIRDRDEPGWAGLVILASLSSLYLLGNAASKAAWAALLLGLVLLFVGGAARRVIAKQRALLLAATFVAFLLGAVGIVAVGLTRGDLFEPSLTFRWRYWVGAWPLFLQHPIAGIGWSNFADHYLATRLPQATEEINDPHDFLVRLAVELGVVGLVLGVAGIIAWAWRATTPTVESAEIPVWRVSFRGILITCGAALVLSIVTSIDLASGDIAYIAMEALKRCLFVGLITLAIAAVAIRSTIEPHVDARPAPWLTTGLFVGLAMLILQSTIDITLFQPGPLMLTAIIAGALVGRGWHNAPPRRESLPLIALMFGGIAWLVMFVLLVVPVALAESSAARADAAIAEERHDLAARYFAEAFERWGPVRNVDYALSAARQHMSVPGHDAQVERWLDIAVTTDPGFPTARLTRGRWRARQYPEAPKPAIEDFAASVEINPNDVDLRVEYADLLERSGQPAAAADQLLAALDINRKMDAKEPERLELRSPGAREQIAARAAALRAHTTRPAT